MQVAIIHRNDALWQKIKAQQGAHKSWHKNYKWATTYKEYKEIWRTL